MVALWKADRSGGAVVGGQEFRLGLCGWIHFSILMLGPEGQDIFSLVQGRESCSSSSDARFLSGTGGRKIWFRICLTVKRGMELSLPRETSFPHISPEVTTFIVLLFFNSSSDVYFSMSLT